MVSKENDLTKYLWFGKKCQITTNYLKKKTSKLARGLSYQNCKDFY
jgi:hypothetical protein